MTTYTYPPSVSQSAPIQYDLNGVPTTVNRDTVTPANSRPLPVELMSSTGIDINVTAAQLNVEIIATGSSPSSVRVSDGTNTMAVNGSLEATVHDASSITALGLLHTDLGSVESNQALQITQETAINTNLGTLNTSVNTLLKPASTLAAITSITNPVAVTGTFWQATQPISGTVTANAGTNLDTSLLALESGGHLASVDSKTPALGQALAVASTPVVLASNQSAIPVTGTFYLATQPVSGTLAVSNLFTLDASTQSTLGSVVAGTAATKSTLIGGIYNTTRPTLTNGQQAGLQCDTDGSLFVNIGDQYALTGSYQEITNLTNTAQTFTAPAGSKTCKVYCDGNNTANIRIKIGGTATAISGVRLEPGRDMDFTFGGNISVICETSATLQIVNVHYGV
jgi:hypothetical protein